MKSLRFILPALLAITTLARGSELAGDRYAAYRARINEVITARIAILDKNNAQVGTFADIASKLVRGEDSAGCSRRVIELMRAPTGDMFWMFPCATVALLGQDKLTAEAKTAIREAWRTYMPMRGDTENHWAMYYTSLYLMSQLYPSEPGERWYTGKSSTENFNEAHDYLLHWMNLATTIGQGEYNCTHYIGEYAIPMLMLATWAQDPSMRQRGRMMLDYILADFAENTLNGIYIGSHARTTDQQVIEKWNGLSSFFSWLFFGNCPAPAAYGGWGPYFAVHAAVSPYVLPDVIYDIATDRDTPFLQRDLKRTRHRWRNSDVRNAPVYKTTYVTKDFALGSDQGGLLQPIQQHSWDVTWAVPDPRGVHNTLFSMHPMAGSLELQTYFTEAPDWMPTQVTFEGKPTYMSEDKLLGGSAYEQIYQERDALVALYNIAPGTRFEHINGFFSKDLSRFEQDPSGWIFAQGGNAYIAYFPLAPYELKPFPPGGQRLVSPHLKNGTIVQVASAGEFASWAAFKDAIKKLALKTSREPMPHVEFTTLRGARLACTYGETPTVDGRPVDFAGWKLFSGPFLNAEKGSRMLTMTHGKVQRVLDFNTGTITDQVTP